MKEQHYRMTLSDAIAAYGYKFGVIYRIYCEKTNFSYVGQTKDVYNVFSGSSKELSRIKTHYNALRKGCHPCLKLQAFWNSTKGKSIKYEILELIPQIEDEGSWKFKKRLSLVEKRWQEVYKHHEELIPERHYPLKAQELRELRDAGIINNATFIYFALKLKNPPVQLPQKWIEKNWEELAAQWYKSKGQSSPAQSAKWENDPRIADWLAIIEETANPLEFATDKEKQDFVKWCNETKQFSWLKEEP